MKAACYDQYGPPDVVSVQDVPLPVPQDGEIRVKVAAAAVTAADSRVRAARFPRGFGFLARLAFGLSKPRAKTLGMCFSGTVDSIGKNVTGFAVGDEVCGMTGIKMGTHAEYLVIRANGSLVKKPAKISHTEAAGMLFGATAALFFVRDKAKVSSGETVLVNGASGAVGSNAVQLAAYYGATVTGVTSGDNAALVTGLGAAGVIDYTKDSLKDSQQKYDVIIDTVGNLTIAAGISLLTDRGRLVLMVASLGQILASGMNRRVITGTASEKPADIAFLLSLMEQGALKAVIDSVYPLSNIVAAHSRVDSGHKAGNVILDLT